MKLKDILNIRYGKNQSDVEVPVSNIPILGTGGIIGYSCRPLYTKPSVLIGRKGTIAKPFYIDKPFWTIDTLFYTEIDENKVIPKYLYYHLSSIELSRYQEGAAVPSLTTKTLYEIDIPVHSIKEQQHIVNTIGTIDDLIENYDNQISKLLNILELSLSDKSLVPFEYYAPQIVKSRIKKYNNTKNYLDTSSVGGINNILEFDSFSFEKRPSRANMEPLVNSIWFAKMKGSKKVIIVTNNDNDLLNDYIFSTGYLGIKATDKLPLSFLVATISSPNFFIQRDLNSVGTTMAGVNNETFNKIMVPKLSDDEIKDFDKIYGPLVERLASYRRKIKKLKELKNLLLNKYF